LGYKLLSLLVVEALELVQNVVLVIQLDSLQNFEGHFWVCRAKKPGNKTKKKGLQSCWESGCVTEMSVSSLPSGIELVQHLISFPIVQRTFKINNGKKTETNSN
jgi:hypothetical protein